MKDTSQTVEDQSITTASRLLFLSLDPKHYESAEYQDLYQNYKRDPHVERFLRIMSEQFELEILNVTDQGIFIAPKPLTFFATRAKDIDIVERTQDKHLLGLILLGLTALIYPNIRFIEDENYVGRKFTIEEIDKFIRSIAENVKKTFPSYEQNPDHERPKLVPLLFKYIDLKYDKGTLTDRSSTRYYIKQVIKYCIKQRFVAEVEENYFHPTLFFKFHVTKLIQDKNLHELLQLKGEDFNAEVE